MSLASGDASRPVNPVHPDLSQTMGARPQKPEEDAISAAASAARAMSQLATIAVKTAVATAILRTCLPSMLASWASSRATTVASCTRAGASMALDARSSLDARATMTREPGRVTAPAPRDAIPVLTNLSVRVTVARARRVRPWRAGGAMRAAGVLIMVVMAAINFDFVVYRSRCDEAE